MFRFTAVEEKLPAEKWVRTDIRIFTDAQYDEMREVVKSSLRELFIDEDAQILESKEAKKRAKAGEPGLFVDRNDGKIYFAEGVTPSVSAEWLYEKVNTGEFNQPHQVRSSSLSDCQRQQWFDILKFRKSPIGEAQPHWRMSSFIGTEIHDALEGYLKRNRNILGYSGAIEITGLEDFVKLEGVLGGKIDVKGTLQTPAGERKFILDWKTVNERDFKLGLKGPKFEKYLAQLGSYQEILGCSYVVVVLVNRNTLEFKEYVLQLPHADAKAYVDRAHGIIRDVIDKVAPPAEKWASDGPTYTCLNFCPFYRQCKLEVEEGFVTDSLRANVKPQRI